MPRGKQNGSAPRGSGDGPTSAATPAGNRAGDDPATAAPERAAADHVFADVSTEQLPVKAARPSSEELLERLDAEAERWESQELPAMEEVPDDLDDDFVEEPTLRGHTWERPALRDDEPTARINSHERAALLDNAAPVVHAPEAELTDESTALRGTPELPAMERIPDELTIDFAEEPTERIDTRERWALLDDDAPVAFAPGEALAHSPTFRTPARSRSDEQDPTSVGAPPLSPPSVFDDGDRDHLEREATEITSLVAHPSLPALEGGDRVAHPLGTEALTPIVGHRVADRAARATQPDRPHPTPPGSGANARSPFADPVLEEPPAEAHTDRWSMPGVTFGRYRLLSHLKAGGMGEVYQAVTASSLGAERPVAIKRILVPLADREEFVTMFIDEARIMVKLNHPAIVQVLEFGVAGDEYFIAMEYVHGRDLDTLARALREEGRPFPVAIATHVVRQVLEGLDHAHRKRDDDGTSAGIVHRDVSPPNILCGFDGLVKLTDFGVAKATSKSSLTRPGQLLGKLCYMAPEQVLELPIDRRTDLFAAGAVLYELLSGGRLFDGHVELQVMEQVLHQQIPKLSQLRPEVPEALSRIVQTALERVPGRRYQWASEMSEALQQVINDYNYLRADRELAQLMVERFGHQPAGRPMSS